MSLFKKEEKCGTLTDPRDDNVYKTVMIGKQVWMAENFNLDVLKGSWIYNSIPQNAETYGRLYTPLMAKRVRPAGWHLPDDYEWEELIRYLGGHKLAGGKLKEAGTTHWKPPNKGATDEVGFCALPGGTIEGGHNRGLNEWTSFWSSSNPTSGATGANAWTLYSSEKEILKEIKRMGIRLIGPNCMGVYSPASGISFGYEFPKESGPLGMFFQSGGAATEFVRYANLRGIRFSKVISYGNALDLNESDFLEYFTHDTETKVIASYMEGTKDGQRFVDTLHKATSVKPVVILKAGRGTAGSRAAASHTAAMAGSSKMWESALLQAGAIQARTMDELLDLVVSFCFTKPILGNSVGIVGGGGGRSVLSADIWEEAGFYLKPLPSAIREEIKKTTQETWWNWVENPVDVSIMPDQYLRGNLLRSRAKNPEYDLIIVNVTVESPRGKEQLIASIKEEADDIIQVKEEGKKPVAAVLNTGPLGIEDFENWRWRLIAEQKSRLIAAQVPVFSSVGQAAETLSRVAQYYQKRKS